MPRHASLAHLCALVVWTHRAIAGAEPCPRAGEPWVQVVFAGSAWSPALRNAVLRELGVELERRSLALCAEPEPNAASVPEQRVTLLADDAQRIAIIPASLEHEGGFVGRTVVVGNIPEDARALAIAQAVDEALRSESTRPSPSPLPPKPAPSALAATTTAAAPKLGLGLALAPTLQVAPAVFDGATRASLAPGLLLRLSLLSSNLGGSLGVALTRTSELAYEHVVIRETRVPLDASLRWRVRSGLFEAMMDLGALAAWVDYDRSGSEGTNRGFELGGRAGLSIAYGRNVLPWFGTSLEFVPRSSALKLTPTGTFGHTPSLWLGFALGTEFRWP